MSVALAIHARGGRRGFHLLSLVRHRLRGREAELLSESAAERLRQRTLGGDVQVLVHPSHPGLKMSLELLVGMWDVPVLSGIRAVALLAYHTRDAVQACLGLHFGLRANPP